LPSGRISSFQGSSHTLKYNDRCVLYSDCAHRRTPTRGVAQQSEDHIRVSNAPRLVSTEFSAASTMDCAIVAGAKRASVLFMFMFMHEFVSAPYHLLLRTSCAPADSPTMDSTLYMHLCIAHPPDSPSSSQPCTGLEIMSLNKFLAHFQAHQAKILTY
jgi:hypothetical protein